MQIFPHHTLLALIFCLILSLSACGQKGNLYLPEANLQSLMPD